MDAWIAVPQGTAAPPSMGLGWVKWLSAQIPSAPQAGLLHPEDLCHLNYRVAV